MAGLKVTRAELTGMGVGGLLMEIVTRPQPRESREADGNRNVAAVILAAGRSTRMGGPNKLLAELGGKPLVRIVTEQALASKASGVIVVTGHQAELVEKALARPQCEIRPQSGFRAGAREFGEGRHRGGAGRCRRRGDLSRRHADDLDAHLIDRLIEAFAPDRGNLIAVPGQR